MKTKVLFVGLIIVAFLLKSCSNDELNEHVVSNVSIEKGASIEDYNLPFADPEELKSYTSKKSNVVDYTLARKIALLEAKETGFVDEMNWNGFQISENPILICDLNPHRDTMTLLL